MDWLKIRLTADVMYIDFLCEHHTILNFSMNQHLRIVKKDVIVLYNNARPLTTFQTRKNGFILDGNGTLQSEFVAM